MTTHSDEQRTSKPEDAVIQWLLDSDPAIRWQVMRDLLAAPGDEVSAERARVATEGWGARLLALQEESGTWAGEAWNQGWNSTMHVLWLLREFGLDPESEQARRAVDRVREQVHWRGWDWDGTWHGADFVGNPFFAGEIEPCINGQVAASGAYFRQDVERIIDRLQAGVDEGPGLAEAAYQICGAAIRRVALAPLHVLAHFFVGILQGTAEPPGPDRDNMLHDLPQRPHARGRLQLELLVRQRGDAILQSLVVASPVLIDHIQGRLGLLLHLFLLL